MKEYTIIKTPNKDLNFYRKQSDTDMIDYRLKTFFIKEPETLIWLQRLNKKDVLVSGIFVNEYDVNYWFYFNFKRI